MAFDDISYDGAIQEATKMIAESNGLDVEKTQALAAAGEFALGLPGPNTGIKAVDATAKGLNYYELKEVTVGLADAYSTQKSSGTKLSQNES